MVTIWSVEFVVGPMPSEFIQANSNGRLHDAREAAVSPLNRGFLYGDAVYEVWRTYDGVIFAWDEHWGRLARSAAALYFVIPWAADDILAEIRRTALAYRQFTGYEGELYVRLQVTRGGGPIGLDVSLSDHPDYVVLVQANKSIPAEKREKGYTLSVETGLRRNSAKSLNPEWKTGNYLNNLLGLRAAKSRGADEVLMLNEAGELTEASTSNVGFVRQGEIVMPPVSVGILAGITRELVLGEVAALAGVAVTEQTLLPSDLDEMDECFLMSTTRDIVSVGAIDDHRFSVGSETVTSRLKSAFADYTRHYVADHSGQHLG